MNTLRKLIGNRWSKLALSGAVLWCGLCLGPYASAIEIEIRHSKSASENRDNPQDFDPDGSKLEATFLAAAQIWEALLPGDGYHIVDIKWSNDLDEDDLGDWSGDPLVTSNNNIRFSSNPDINWFYDSTPLEHSEYAFSDTQYHELTPEEQEEGFLKDADLYTPFPNAPPEVLEVGYGGTAYLGSGADTGFDMLSVALHELGHELGINDWNVWPGWNFNRKFVGDRSGTGVWREEGHFPIDQPLMSPSIPANTRVLPSATDVFAIAHSHGHNEVALERIDFISGTDWHTGTNWIGGSVPNANSQVSMRNPNPLAIRDVSLSDNADARSLYMSEGTTLATADHLLRVGETTEVDGAGTTLYVDAGGAMNAGNLLLQRGGVLELRGGLVNVTDDYLAVDIPSAIVGHGDIRIVGANQLVNNGAIRALGGTLKLESPFSGVSMDLDGTLESGGLYAVDGNLQVVGELSDAFDGRFEIRGGRTAEFTQGWEMSGTGIVSDNGNILGATINGPTVLSGHMTTQANENLTFNGGFTLAPGGTLQVDANSLNWLSDSITYDGGYITGDGTVVQDADATVTNFTRVDVDRFYLNGTAFWQDVNQTEIQEGATLRIDSRAIHPTQPGLFEGLMNLNGGTLIANLNGGFEDFVLSDTDGGSTDLVASMNFRHDGGAIPKYRGSRLVMGENAYIHVENADPIGSYSEAEIAASTRFDTGRVEIDGNATLELSQYNQFTGDTYFAGRDGTLRLTGEAESVVYGTPIVEPRLLLESTLNIVDGRLEVLDRTEIVGGRLNVRFGYAMIGTGGNGATLDIGDGVVGGHARQSSNGVLSVSDYDYTGYDAAFYVDSPFSAEVKIGIGGSLETTHSVLASREGGSALVSLDGGNWQNYGPMYVGGNADGSGGDALVELLSGSVVTGIDPGSNVHVYESDRLHMYGGSFTIGAGPAADINQLRINRDHELHARTGQVNLGTGSRAADGVTQVDDGFSVAMEPMSALQTDLVDLSGELKGAGAVYGSVVGDSTAVVEAGLPTGDLFILEDYSTAGTTSFNIGGTAPSEFSRLIVGGEADITGSTLDVDLISLVSTYVPAIGDTFELLRAGEGLVGDFASTLLPTMSGVSWWVEQRSSPFSTTESVWLTAGLAGDFDRDLDVDGYDYRLWLSGNSPNPRSASDLADWKANYGSRVSLSSAIQAVPEPSTLMLAALAIPLLRTRRNRQRGEYKL